MLWFVGVGFHEHRPVGVQQLIIGVLDDDFSLGSWGNIEVGFWCRYTQSFTEIVNPFVVGDIKAPTHFKRA